MELSCQRDLFDIPTQTTYLNCAYMGPLLQSAVQSGQEAMKLKTQPWAIQPEQFFESMEDLRSCLARTIQTSSEHIALIPSVSYGMSIAALNIPLNSNQNILLLEDQFPSNVYVWRNLARSKGASIHTIKRPRNYDWTHEILKCMDSETGLVALPIHH